MAYNSNMNKNYQDYVIAADNEEKGNLLHLK